MAERLPSATLTAMPWQLTSLIALTTFTISLLCFRGATGAGPLVQLLPVLLIGAVLTSLRLYLTGTSLSMPMKDWGLIILAGIACWIGNLAQLDALAKAPNPGLALAIIGSSVAVITLIAWPLFGCPISAGKATGLALCVAGVILVSILP